MVLLDSSSPYQLLSVHIKVLNLLVFQQVKLKIPQKNIVKAVNGVIWRILIFYLGAIFVIVSVYPWDKLGDIGSPFVATFAKVGITFAAGLINFVVLTAALSGCNSGIFSASRMIYTLSRHGQMPKIFSKVMKNGVPFYTVLAVSIGILIGALLNVILPLLIKGQIVFSYTYIVLQSYLV